jgi:hypothetical protein
MIIHSSVLALTMPLTPLRFWPDQKCGRSSHPPRNTILRFLYDCLPKDPPLPFLPVKYVSLWTATYSAAPSALTIS